MNNARRYKYAQPPVCGTSMKKNILVFFISVAVCLSPLALKHIHAWEKTHNYPFGHMCYSLFTAGKYTCPDKITERYYPQYINTIRQ